MGTVDLCIIFFVVFIIYLCVRDNKSKDETFKSTKCQHDCNEHVDEFVDSLRTGKVRPSKQTLNQYFNDTQFNNYYRDVITAFNNVAPRQRQIFNLENVPIKVGLCNKSEVNIIVRDFIDAVNKNIKMFVPESREPSTL